MSRPLVLFVQIVVQFCSTECSRLALLVVLRMKPQSIGVLAPICSSMGVLASGTTQRSFISPLGRTDLVGVDTGNLLAIRSFSFAEGKLCKIDL